MQELFALRAKLLIAINKHCSLRFYFSLFLVFLILFSKCLFKGLKFVIKFLVPDKPETATILEKRHKYVINRMLPKSTTTKSYYIIFISS